MGKYLIHWEMDQARMPIDPKERGGAWSLLMAMVRQDYERGIVKDFGMFVGQSSGYAVHEGTEVEVMNTLQQYVPFAIFKVYPVASEDQTNEMIKALTG